MRLCNSTLVLVVDGSRMMILRNIGDEVYPNFEVIEHCRFDNQPDRQLARDAPGVAFSTGNPGRDTMDEGSLHQTQEDRFILAALNAVSTRLSSGSAGAEPAQDLIIAAPPHALGLMRKHYDRTILAHLAGEVSKDLTKHPVNEIASHLIAEDEASDE